MEKFKEELRICVSDVKGLWRGGDTVEEVVRGMGGVRDREKMEGAKGGCEL